MEKTLTVTVTATQAREINLALVWLSLTPEALSDERRQQLVEISKQFSSR